MMLPSKIFVMFGEFLLRKKLSHSDIDFTALVSVGTMDRRRRATWSRRWCVTSDVLVGPVPADQGRKNNYMTLYDKYTYFLSAVI